MPTKLQVKTAFRGGGFYPSCPSAIANDLFDDAYKFLCQELRLKSSETLITLSAGVNLYSLPSTIGAVFDAHYEDSAGSYMPLMMVTESTKEERYPNWRGVTGTPILVYKTQGSVSDSSDPYLGVYPAPTDASDPTYPRIVLRETLLSTLDDADTLPTGLLDMDVILYRMAYKYSRRLDDGKADRYHRDYTEELATARKHIQGMEKAPLGRITTTLFRGQTRNW